MEFVKTLLALIKALNAFSVQYVVVGGAALNIHGLARATQDIDLFVAPDPMNIERLRSALRSVWDDPCIDEIDAEELCGDYPAIRYGPPEGSVYLDILTRLGERWSFDALEAASVELGGLPVSVATPLTLYRMKRDTVRSIDRADAEALREAFEIAEDEDAS